MISTGHINKKEFPQAFMNRKAYLKDPYFDDLPRPFTGWDYLLCAVAFFLVGIASVPAIAALIVGAGR
jgi:hypothetical protein